MRRSNRQNLSKLERIVISAVEGGDQPIDVVLDRAGVTPGQVSCITRKTTFKRALADAVRALRTRRRLIVIAAANEAGSKLAKLVREASGMNDQVHLARIYRDAINVGEEAGAARVAAAKVAARTGPPKRKGGREDLCHPNSQHLGMELLEALEAPEQLHSGSVRTPSPLEGEGGGEG